MPNDAQDSLVADLARLADKHPRITGRQFLEACERVARGLWPPDEPAMSADEIVAEFAEALREPQS